MKRLVAATAVATVALTTSVLGAGSAGATGTAGAADTGTVYVVHGIPGLPVDVYVNGALTLDNFAPATVAGPLELPPGSYAIAITAADAADASAPVLTATADVTADANVALVAHLKEDGTPTITPFVNDVSTIAAGKTRLVVRHTAAAPAVDIRAGGTVVLPGVTNPQQGVLNIAAGTVSADVVLAGTTTVAIGPASLNLTEGSATFVHAIGSAADNTLALVSYTITGLHSAPGGVPAGTGPMSSTLPTALVVLMVLAGLTAVGFGTRRLLASAN